MRSTPLTTPRGENSFASGDEPLVWTQSNDYLSQQMTYPPRTSPGSRRSHSLSRSLGQPTALGFQTPGMNMSASNNPVVATATSQNTSLISMSPFSRIASPLGQRMDYSEDDEEEENSMSSFGELKPKNNAFHLAVKSPLEILAIHRKVKGGKGQRREKRKEMTWKEVVDESEKIALNNLSGIGGYSEGIGKNLRAKDVRDWNAKNTINLKLIRKDLNNSRGREIYEKMEEFRKETEWRLCGISPMDPTHIF